MCERKTSHVEFSNGQEKNSTRESRSENSAEIELSENSAEILKPDDLQDIP